MLIDNSKTYLTKNHEFTIVFYLHFYIKGVKFTLDNHKITMRTCR